MTPLRKVLGCPLAVVLVSACADVNSPTATAPVQPQFSSAVPVPIAGQCDVRYTLDTSVPTQLAMSGTGSCQLSHLGRTSVQVAQIADFSQARVTGTVTFSAANGDRLYGRVGAPITGGQVAQLQGDVTFVGGTGRFADAAGSATFTSAGNAPQNAVITYAGSIQYGRSESSAGFTLDAARAVTRTVDIEGATLTARSASGVDYELVIPRGALNEPVTITMTPIASAQNFPTSGGFAAGVDFAPAGLRFAQVAHLRITLPTRRPGFQLIVTAYDADPASLLPLLAADDGAVVDVPVAHFSGVAAGFGTSADLLAMPNPGPTTQSGYYIAQLAAVPVSPLTDAEKLTANTQILVAWLTSVVQPLFVAANTDLQLLLAMSEYDLWHGHALTLGLTAALDADITDTKAMAAVKLLVAVDGNADRCGAQQSLAALYNVGFWYLQAVYIDVAQPQHFLDRRSVAQSISSRCLTIELESVGLPSPIVVGTPYTLSLVWGIRFKGQTTLQGVPLEVAVGPIVAGTVTIAPASGLSDVAGLFETVITAHSSGTVDFVAAACMLLPGLATPPPDPTCGQDLLVTEGLVVEWPAVDAVQVAVTPSSVTLAPAATQQFDATVTGTGNTAVTWTATGGTITAGGFYTAGVVPGSYTVRATSAADPTISAVAQVTIGSAFTGTLLFEAQGNPVVPWTNACPFQGFSVPVAFSGTFDADGANLSGPWAGQLFCWSGAPQGNGTVSLTLTRRDLGGGVIVFDASVSLQFLGFNPLRSDNVDYVGCEYRGPFDFWGGLLSPIFTVQATVFGGLRFTGWLAPVGCAPGVGHYRVSIEFRP